ncbi:MAG: TIGR03621 family F420-dependent LLM class oxidoreductase [Dehalococcoidia bacterium]
MAKFVAVADHEPMSAVRTRPFRFGVSILGPADRESLVGFARRAEDLGYDILTVPDHVADGLLSPFTTLATVASATDRLRIGTLVLNNDLRHPALAAREAATLHALSGGRMELGLGAGHAAPEYAALGLPFDEATTRVDRLTEAASVVRRLLGGETVTFEGAHYALTAHALWPPPQSPLPLLIGGNNRRLLRLAAREADIVGFTGLGRTLEDGQRHEPSGFAPSAVDERVALVRAAAGDRLNDLEFHALVQAVVITDDRRASATTVAATAPPLTADDVLGSPFVLVGTPDEMTEELRAYRARFGMSYFTVFDRYLEDFAPVVRALAGT